ncbi:MAG TPA: EamA family transporter [Geminicoccus sp.]|jgi:drug/metabolite transporter (DMT)-like permease|uniref:DMT family transporter n=1 Tax=Geminicoccus sp. TaxID=2024832 RepID=UPI002E381655|nr:EamA family transporter [Geminicoccus sp.]HEX2528346.1 EamA family transporter [Geminicoccus sp.]
MEPTTASYRRGVLLVVLATCFFSLSGILVRLTEDAGGWQIIFYRSLTLTCTMLAVLAVNYRQRMAAVIWSAGWNGLLAGTASCGALVFYILALQTITVANALFMVGIAPFITALLGRVFLKEPIPAVTWVAMCLGTAGVAVMVEGAVSFDRVAGNLLALGSAVSFALLSFFLRRGRQGDMLPGTLLSGVISAALAFVILALGTGEVGTGFAIGPWDLGLCIIMGVVQLGLGMLCYTRGARHVPAAQLQLLAMVELAMAPLWVWLIVSEVPPRTALLGGLLILAATMLQAVAGGLSRRGATASTA